MELLADTSAIFAQLAAIPGTQAVKTLIENHDAWSHCDTVQALARARLAAGPRSVMQEARIARQRQALAPLVTRLPMRYASAG